MRSTCWGPGPDSDCIICDEHACCHPFDLAAALSPLLLEWALAKCVAFIPCSVCSTISSQGYMTLEESGGGGTLMSTCCLTLCPLYVAHASILHTHTSPWGPVHIHCHCCGSEARKLKAGKPDSPFSADSLPSTLIWCLQYLWKGGLGSWPSQ